MHSVALMDVFHPRMMDIANINHSNFLLLPGSRVCGICKGTRKSKPSKFKIWVTIHGTIQTMRAPFKFRVLFKIYYTIQIRKMNSAAALTSVVWGLRHLLFLSLFGAFNEWMAHGALRKFICAWLNFTNYACVITRLQLIILRSFAGWWDEMFSRSSDDACDSPTRYSPHA